MPLTSTVGATAASPSSFSDRVRSNSCARASVVTSTVVAVRTRTSPGRRATSRTRYSSGCGSSRDDSARRHGEVRVRTATTVLVTTEALAQELLRTRSLTELGLAAVAPTVLVSGTPRATVLEKVRRAGHFPVAEDPSGAVVVEKSGPRRTTVRAAPSRDRVPAEDLAAALGGSVLGAGQAHR